MHPAMSTGGMASSTMRPAMAWKASAAGPSPRATGAPVSPPVETAGSSGTCPSRGTPMSDASASPPPVPNKA